MTLTPPVIVYNRHRLLPILAPILPSSLTSRLAHYTPLASYSFNDQVAAGLSSGNFDVERDNLGEGSSEARLGMDEAGVEEVRRIMSVNQLHPHSHRQASGFQASFSICEA